MEQPFDLKQLESRLDLQELEARFQQVRHSEYFPAILGAVAGGLTGALMAGLIAGGRRTERESEKAPADKGVVLGFTAKDLLQLATVTAGLMRQLRQWRDEG